MPQSKQHLSDTSATTLQGVPDAVDNAVIPTRPGGERPAAGAPADIDKHSPEWRAFVGACEALNLSEAEERVAAGNAVDKAAGALLAALGYRYFTAGLPNLPGVPLLPGGDAPAAPSEQRPDWRDLLLLAGHLHGALGNVPIEGAVAERAENLLAQAYPLFVDGMRRVESKSPALHSSPSTGYDGQRKQKQDDGPGILRKQKDGSSPTTTPAGAEITKRRPPSKLPGYVLPGREGKVGLSTHIEPELREAFKAIAKLNGTTTEALLREVLLAVVEHYQNPEHVGASVGATVDRYKSAVSTAALRLVKAPSK